MFAQAESDELVRLLTRVRLVVDAEVHGDAGPSEATPPSSSALGSRLFDGTSATLSGGLSKGHTSLSSAVATSGGAGDAFGPQVGRYTASSTVALAQNSWTVQDNSDGGAFKLNPTTPSTPADRTTQTTMPTALSCDISVALAPGSGPFTHNAPNAAEAAGGGVAEFFRYAHGAAAGGEALARSPAQWPRTPATDAKVLRRAQPSLECGTAIDEDSSSTRSRASGDAVRQPKPLFFSSSAAAAAAALIAPTTATTSATATPVMSVGPGIVKDSRTPLPAPLNSSSVSSPSVAGSSSSGGGGGGAAGRGSGYTAAPRAAHIAVTGVAVSPRAPGPDTAAAAPRFPLPVPRDEQPYAAGAAPATARAERAGGIAAAWTPSQAAGYDAGVGSISPQPHYTVRAGGPQRSPGAVAVEAAVAQFFNINGGGAGGGAAADVSDIAAYRALHEEAELADLLLRSGAGVGLERLPVGGPATGSAAAHMPATNPAVSPLQPTSTTPYHQLLSHLRQSPSQLPPPAPSNGSAGAAGPRANTPPDRRPFSVSARANTAGRAGPAVAADPTVPVRAPMYTAAVTSVPRPSSVPAPFPSDQPQPQPQRRYPSPQSHHPFHPTPMAAWSPTSAGLSGAEAAAVWERMSPYERAAAAAAAASVPRGGQADGRPSSASPAHTTAAAALFRTPDTVAKPVTLSSIAAQLHGGGGGDGGVGELGSPAEALAPVPLAFTTAPMGHGSRPGSGAALFANAAPALPPASPSTGVPTASAAAGGALPCPRTHVPWTPSHSARRMEDSATSTALQSPSASLHSGRGQPNASHMAPPPLASAVAAAAAAAAAAHRSPQSHLQTPSSMRRWSPVDAPAPAAGAGCTTTTNSPPSCSLRPSPHPRASNGGSPALRRYTIMTTPTPTAAAHAQASSSGRRSAEGSPLTGAGAASAAGAARESRPRVQLSLSTQHTLPYQHSHGPSTVAGGTGRGTRGAGVGVTSPHGPYSPHAGGTATGHGGHHAQPTTYHHPHAPTAHHPTSAPLPTAPATSPNAATLAGGLGSAPAATAALVSATAVQALVQRLQAAAAATPFDSAVSVASPLSRTSSPAHPSAFHLNPSHGSGPLSNTANTSTNTIHSGSSLATLTVVPEVASAAAILAMSQDQHGCRLLQAVLDAECGEGEVLDGGRAEGSTTSPADDAAGGADRRPSYGHGGAAQATAVVSERRRQRRAEAFEHSVAVRVILRAIEAKLDTVMADGYGNFLLQKVFDMAPDAERQRLLRLPSLQHHLCEVACSPHGTFAVQRLVETVRNAEEEQLVFVALERDLLRLLTNANGGHVLMKVMECIRRQLAALASSAASGAEESGSAHFGGLPPRRLLEERVEALFQAIQQHLLYVCQHKQGCCIVQKCFEFFNICAGFAGPAAGSPASAPAMDYFERVSALLLPHVSELAMHPFGNYVVTRLVDVCYARGSTSTIDAVAAGMQRELLRMCTNKFASNVVEHILHHCSERRIRMICKALMVPSTAPLAATPSSTSGNISAAALNAAVARLPLTTVVMDSYGNYVIQTLLTVAPVDELVRPDVSTAARAAGDEVPGGMLPVLQQVVPLLSSRNFGRKLETKTELAQLWVEQQHQQQRRQ